jgi:Rps23 Pro-64 3,4-dihydroxylase Tpa1-like proline 4-hydroxylase
MRSIAMLYYLNNTSIESGGTGIYDGYAGNLLKNIEPVNNRLFLFEINHKSFHTFMGADFNRSAIVCWYHSSPSYILNKYRTVIESNPNFIERWTQNPEGGYWDVKQDPEHNR